MPAHNITPPPPWCTLFTTLISANRAPTQRHTTLSAICPDHTSPACQGPSKVSISTQMSFPGKVLWQFLPKFFSFISCLGGWSQTIPQVKKPDLEVLGWRGYVWSAVVRSVGRTAKFPKTMLKMAYGREINIKFSGNSSGGHSCSQHANCTLHHNLRNLALCCVTKLHILEWPFIVPITKVHLCNDHTV